MAKEPIFVGSAVGALALLLLLSFGQDQAQSVDSPYPPSDVITSINFDESSYNNAPVNTGYSQGDSWSFTWADDGHQHGFCADCGGFEPDDVENIGQIRIEGNSGNPGAWQGFDLETDIETPGFYGKCTRKVSGIIQVDGDFYAAVRNFNQGSACGGEHSVLYESTDGGSTWTEAS